MNDLNDLQEVVEILKKQEEMLALMEAQQAEAEALKKENRQLKFLVSRSTEQNKKLQAQITTLKDLK